MHIRTKLMELLLVLTLASTAGLGAAGLLMAVLMA